MPPRWRPPPRCSTSSAPRCCATASRRCRRSRRTRASIPAGVEEADVFAIAQDGRADLRRGVLLPHRPELGQPRLLPARRPLAGAGRGAGELHQPVLRRQAGAAADAGCRTRCRRRRCWRRRSRPRPAAGSRSPRPQRGEKCELVDHARHNAREALGRRLAESASQAEAARGAGRGVRPAAAAARGSRSTTTPTSWAPTRSAPWWWPGRRASARRSTAPSTSARPTSPPATISA